MRMDADLNTYSILILPASNILYFCHHPTASSWPIPTTFHPSSSTMATSDIKLTQFPKSQFSSDSKDILPHFAHLLSQSNDPVLKMTHAIGDTVQFTMHPMEQGDRWDNDAGNSYWMMAWAGWQVSRMDVGWSGRESARVVRAWWGYGERTGARGAARQGGQERGRS